MLLLISLIVFLFCWMIWLRYFYFVRQPKFQKQYIENVVKSPVQGRVVYLKYNVNKQDICVCKSDEFQGKRLFKIHDDLRFDTYNQIGIFMTQYDTHYVINQVDSSIKAIKCYGNNNQSGMLNFIDFCLSLFGIRFLNWISSSQRYIHYNQQWMIQYENGILVVITMDKYVNKFDYQIKTCKTPYILGFVHRGSQADIFVPNDMFDSFLVDINDKVSYDTKIVQVKK